jgi:hypothetical protein
VIAVITGAVLAAAEVVYATWQLAGVGAVLLFWKVATPAA